jgi:hypothetical protein
VLCVLNPSRASYFAQLHLTTSFLHLNVN